VVGPVRLVGIDGDDTLWRCQDPFDEAEGAFCELVAPWASPAELGEALALRESANRPLFGYGIKGFTISAVEVAVDLSRGDVPARTVQAILDVGRALLEHAVEVLPDAETAVAALARTHKVVLVTKGDLVDQQRKLRLSGLAKHFAHVEIVSEKDPATYEELLVTLECPAEQFVMIGNSERSDVEPVLAIGAWAVHVPYHTTWRSELVGEPSLGHPRRRAVASLAEIPALLEG
jgi:putative hydrolase of the HAD superfamily